MERQRAPCVSVCVVQFQSAVEAVLNDTASLKCHWRCGALQVHGCRSMHSSNDIRFYNEPIYKPAPYYMVDVVCVNRVRMKGLTTSNRDILAVTVLCFERNC